MSLRAATGAATGAHAQTVATEAMSEALSRLREAPNAALVFASPRFNLATILAIVHAMAPSTAIAGVTTAGEITEWGCSFGGLSIMLLAGDEAEILIEHYSSEVNVGDPDGATLIARRDAATKRGLRALNTLLLTDGLSGCAPGLLRQLQNVGGALHNIVGGGAGDERTLKRTWVGSEGRLLDTGAIALHLLSRQPWVVAVAQGFAPATASMQVTRAAGNVIHELEGRPAVEVYQKYAETFGVTLSPESAGPFSLNSPLAVLMFREVKYIRMVVGIEPDGALRCNGEIPSGSSVSVLGASPDVLLRAARLAAAEAKSRLGERQAAGVLMFASVARQGILLERYHLEIAAVREAFPEVPVAGFLTYGEIARYSGKLDAWHNSSLVIAVIPS